MSDSDRQASSGCTGGCPNCGSLRDCDAAAGGGLTGWALAGSAACMFLLPIAAAAAGAGIAGGGKTRQFVGAMIGLLAGLVVGVLAARIIGRSPKEKS